MARLVELVDAGARVAPEDTTPEAGNEDGMSDEAMQARRALQESIDLRDQGHVDHQ